jgi:septum formation inhibitor-activating ATPase MinD
VGRIPYDDTVLQSINELIPIIYYSGSKANQAIREAWKRIKRQLFVSENKEERKQ